MAADPREPYGRLVHEQRLAFNAEKERPFVLLPWEDRDEHQRELDMAIGAAVAAAERERIRQLAIGYGAVYGGIKDGTPSLMHSFADVIGEPEERSDEKEAAMAELPDSVPAATVVSFGTETAGSMAVSPANTPGDHAACDAEIARLRAALRRHVPSFTDPKGAVLCGGCLRPAPCPDAPLAGGGPS